VSGLVFGVEKNEKDYSNLLLSRNFPHFPQNPYLPLADDGVSPETLNAGKVFWVTVWFWIGHPRSSPPPAPLPPQARRSRFKNANKSDTDKKKEFISL